MHKLGNNESLGYDNFRNETDTCIIVPLKCPSHCQYHFYHRALYVIFPYL